MTPIKLLDGQRHAVHNVLCPKKNPNAKPTPTISVPLIRGEHRLMVKESNMLRARLLRS